MGWLGEEPRFGTALTMSDQHFLRPVFDLQNCKVDPRSLASFFASLLGCPCISLDADILLSGRESMVGFPTVLFSGF